MEYEIGRRFLAGIDKYITYPVLGLDKTGAGVLFLGWSSNAGCEMVDKDIRCNGSIAQCHEEEELFMESEISRRFLAGTDKYITYPVLGPDKTGLGGKSEPGQPYNRGCKKIYGCREDS
ncbi:hypothetical protein AAC387_Pa02g1383 [Persea americana]